MFTYSKYILTFFLTAWLHTLSITTYASPDLDHQRIDENSLLDMHFHDTPLATIFYALAQHQGYNLVLAQPLPQTLSITFNQVRWQHAFDTLLLTQHLIADKINNILIIQPAPPLSFTTPQAVSIPPKQLEKAIIPINYIPLPNMSEWLTTHINAKLSADGYLILNPLSHQLIIHDYPTHIEAIKTLLFDLDKAPAQIYLSAHIVTINREQLNEIGVKWQSENVLNSPQTWLSIPLTFPNPSAHIGLKLGTWQGHFLNLELAALEAENEVEIMANPRLLTYHQQTASIKQGTEIPYEVSHDGTTSFEFKQAVLGLHATPTILPNNQIILSLSISQNTPGSTIKRKDGSEMLTIDTQEIQTQVIVNNNETIVLGGILQQHKHQHAQQVPLLGQLPLLGGLFKHRKEKQINRELIIFITPTITSEKTPHT